MTEKMISDLNKIIKNRQPLGATSIEFLVFGGMSSEYPIDNRLYISGNGFAVYSTIGDSLKTPKQKAGRYTIFLESDKILNLLKLFQSSKFLSTNPEGGLEPDSVYSSITLRVFTNVKELFYYDSIDDQNFYKIKKPKNYKKLEDNLKKIVKKLQKSSSI